MSEETYFHFNAKFLEVLNIQEAIMTKFQALNHLQSYIWERRLFNPRNPVEMILGKDPLGELFGVETFTAYNTLKLLAPLMSIVKRTESDNVKVNAPENSQRRLEISNDVPSSSNTQSDVELVDKSETSNIENIKRKEMDNSGCSEDLVPIEKKSKQEDIAYLYIPPLPAYDSSEESDLSIQSKETEYIRDSGDRYYYYDDPFYNGSSSECERDPFEVEYEVASIPSGQEVSDTDSDIEDIILATVLTCKDDSDVQFWADNSDDERSDPELSVADKWTCKKCGSLNKPPIRFCQRCWEERNNWLPEGSVRHPPIRKRRKAKINSRKNKDNTFGEKQVFEKSISQELPSTSEPLTVSSLVSLNGIENSFTFKRESKCSNDLKDQLCPVCMKQPKTGVFVHGRTSHQYCCYQCARKIEKTDKTCPVCRRTIKTVTRNFYVDTDV